MIRRFAYHTACPFLDAATFYGVLDRFLRNRLFRIWEHGKLEDQLLTVMITHKLHMWSLILWCTHLICVVSDAR